MTGDRRGPVEVTVEIDGEEIVAGTMRITERRGQSMTFEYAPNYLAQLRAYPLDPVLPPGTGVFQPPAGASVFTAFADAAPDRWGQNLMRRAEERRARNEGTSARRLGQADFLLGTRDDLRQGAIRFRDPLTLSYYTSGPYGVPAVIELRHLLAEVDRLGHVVDVGDDDVTDLILAGSSLGGARPKAAVCLPDSQLAIAKFPHSGSDEWDVAAWEMVENELAGRSGISAARAQLVSVSKRNVIVIERFDRIAGGRVRSTSAA
ncbi:MAG TPA: HipA domain-containing protein [Acidimicrobiales bacterium]|nr:HipA domain-containing protein [Acidimicrobiales bacterium]